ncbi:unnamed protein product [Blepharisma stoltei]|uniref:Charged multivesicular body protein 2a n=1 Tax=Blepharisma stoltei TaxID=1481888 RepID=A0AAU9JQM8_9CILI|nr:unnamed protein product [Blepharisma stoltei]
MGATNPKLSPQEQLRVHRRGLKKAQRELDRERSHLQLEEKKLIAEIKKLAKQNQISSVKVMAKDLVRVRKQIQKFYELKSQLQGLDFRLQTMRSTQAMSETLRGITPALTQFNKEMNLPELNKMMQDFNRENQRMEMTEEMMGDAMEMAFDNEGDIEESDNVVNQVLSEIGVEIAGQLDSGPTGKIKNGMMEEEKTPPVDDLESRFNALK